MSLRRLTRRPDKLESSDLGWVMRGTGPVLTLTALALLLAALPDLLRSHSSQPRPWATLATAGRTPEPPPLDPSLRPLALLEEGLLQRLEEADQGWVPRAEPLPEGGTRYVYRRRAGDPELSLSQIRALIADPPSFEPERQTIVSLLSTLEEAGAAVGLIEPIKPGAAAEWDPGERTLRIRPDLPDQGSLQLARVLNHEAIHVAQSCAAGGIGANPRPLGLVQGVQPGTAGSGEGRARDSGPAAPMEQLQDPVYADLGPRERRMEQEAYSLQDRLEVGAKLLRIHCLTGRKG